MRFELGLSMSIGGDVSEDETVEAYCPRDVWAHDRPRGAFADHCDDTIQAIRLAAEMAI